MLIGSTMVVIRIAFVLIAWVFILSCAPNVMGNRILDNKDISHVYLIERSITEKYW